MTELTKLYGTTAKADFTYYSHLKYCLQWGFFAACNFRLFCKQVRPDTVLIEDIGMRAVLLRPLTKGKMSEHKTGASISLYNLFYLFTHFC